MYTEIQKKSKNKVDPLLTTSKDDSAMEIPIYRSL